MSKSISIKNINNRNNMLEIDDFKSYLRDILMTSDNYLRKVFKPQRYYEFLNTIKEFDDENLSVEEIVSRFSLTYEQFVKEDYQKKTSNSNKALMEFIHNDPTSIKIIWGDAYKTLKQMDSESIHLMVTSPPYYNAREYSKWSNLKEYLDDMERIIRECYRVLDNHRVFVFNVGDIFDNDNLITKSVWGKRRIPLGAYFINIFEKVGFRFVDDFIWDKGEVQTQRHKHKPYPFYQYPINCYEHIMVFHKHRLDETRYPCPICGSLKVNDNTQSEIGVQSWECKNYNCFKRSKSNRGKRFSLKTNIIQRNQTLENMIEKELIDKWRRDIVRFAPVIKINPNGVNVLGHTAPFPKDIPEFAIKFFSYKGDIVLDPFAGSFTTAIVAKKLGRVGVGIEINKEMFRESILKRIRKEFNNTLIREFDML